MIAGVAYHRVSTLDQNPELARDELRRAAAARGITLALEVEETGSGAKNDRPGLLRVLEAAKRGKVAAVLVWKLDRFGRSALDVLTNVDTLAKAGVRFVAVTQGLDVAPGGDPTSRLILVVLSAVAEFERELIRERTRLGLDKARKLGRVFGRPVAIGADDRAKVTALAAQGKGAYAIAKQLGLKESTVRRFVATLGGGHA